VGDANRSQLPIPALTSGAAGDGDGVLVAHDIAGRFARASPACGWGNKFYKTFINYRRIFTGLPCPAAVWRGLLGVSDFSTEIVAFVSRTVAEAHPSSGDDSTRKQF